MLARSASSARHLHGGNEFHCRFVFVLSHSAKSCYFPVAWDEIFRPAVFDVVKGLLSLAEETLDCPGSSDFPIRSKPRGELELHSSVSRNRKTGVGIRHLLRQGSILLHLPCRSSKTRVVNANMALLGFQESRVNVLLAERRGNLWLLLPPRVSTGRW